MNLNSNESVTEGNAADAEHDDDEEGSDDDDDDDDDDAYDDEREAGPPAKRARRGATGGSGAAAAAEEEDDSSAAASPPPTARVKVEGKPPSRGADHGAVDASGPFDDNAESQTRQAGGGAGTGEAMGHAQVPGAASRPSGMLQHDMLLSRLAMNQQHQPQQQQLSQYPTSSFASSSVGATAPPPSAYFPHQAAVGGGGGAMSYLDPRFLAGAAMGGGGPVPTTAMQLYMSSQQQQQHQQQQQYQHPQGPALYAHHSFLLPSGPGAAPGAAFPHPLSNHLPYSNFWAGGPGGAANSSSATSAGLGSPIANGFLTTNAALMLQHQQQQQQAGLEIQHNHNASAAARGYAFPMQGLDPSTSGVVAPHRVPTEYVTAGGAGAAGGDAGPVESTSGDPSSQRVFPMSHATDEDSISKYQCLLRKQIEFFEATSVDLKARAQGRNIPIRLRQIGIRCRHCASSGIPPGYRPRGSVYFPVKLASLYQSAQNMANNHWNTNACSSIPEPVVAELNDLKRCKSSGSGSGGQRHWVRTAQAIGIVDSSESGLVYVGVKGEREG